MICGALTRQRALGQPAIIGNILAGGHSINACPAFITDFCDVLDLILLPRGATWKMICLLSEEFGPSADEFAIIPTKAVISNEFDYLDYAAKLECYASLLKLLAFARNQTIALHMRRALMDIVVRLIDLRKTQPSCSTFTSRKVSLDFCQAGQEVVNFLGQLIEQWIIDPEGFATS